MFKYDKMKKHELKHKAAATFLLICSNCSGCLEKKLLIFVTVAGVL